MTIFESNPSPRLLRKTQSRIFYFLCCYLFCLAVAALTPQEIASKAFPSVVVVIAQNNNGEDFAYGSGFFVAPDLVATNLHVIEGAAKVRIRPIGSETESDVTGFTAVDYDNDLVLLKTQVKDGKPLIVAEDSLVSVGDDVYVIGNPQGLEGTFSKGMVSGKRDVNNRKILQITAPISQGSSGGPVLSEKGEIIGVAVAYVAEGQNLNFAIPSSLLQILMKNQHDSRTLASFKGKEIKKVSPSSLDTEPIPVAFGNVLLHLGMPEDEAKEKVSAYYDIAGVSGRDGQYIVCEKRKSDFRTIGQFSCEEGKVVYIGRNFGDVSAVDDIFKMFKTMQARLQELEDNGVNICIVDTQATKGSYDSVSVSTYVINLNFNNYTVQFAANEINGEYSFVFYDMIEQK